MSKKKAAKKKAAKKAAKKAPGRAAGSKAGAALTSTQRGAALARISRRRSFSLVDRLPEDLREWVREKFADPSVEYTDIAEHVLIQTTAPSLRDQLRADLDWAERKARDEFPEDGLKRAEAYLAKRRDIYRKLLTDPATRAAAKKGEHGGDPVLLSQSVLSRDYRRAMESIKEVEEHISIAGDLLERLGTRSVSSIGILVANQLLLRCQTFVMEAKSIAEINEGKHALNAASRFFKSVVDYERGDAKSAVALKRARQQLRGELEQFLAANPDLRERLDKYLADREAS